MRHRVRRRAGDGLSPNDEVTSSLHPPSGGGSRDVNSISSSNGGSATAAMFSNSNSTANSGGQLRGDSRAPLARNFCDVPAQTLDKIRGKSMMDQQRQMPSGTASISSTCSPAVDDGISLSGTGGGADRSEKNRRMIHEQNDSEETVEFHRHDETQQPQRRPLWPAPTSIQDMQDATNNTANEGEAPVYTESGLQLTHRHSPLRGTSSRASRDSIGIGRSNDVDNNVTNSRRNFISGLSVEQQNHNYYTDDDKQRRMLAYVRLGVVALCAFLAVGTGVAVTTALHERRMMATSSAAAASSTLGTDATTNARSRELQTKMGKVVKPPSLSASTPTPPGATTRRKRHYAEEVVRTLRLEFDAWAGRHGRNYGSKEETERRFGVWLDNHHDTIDLNERHGPCQMTGKAVFGDNHFKDLTKEEFASKYLTGYTGPRAEEVPRHRLQRIDEAMERKLREEIKKKEKARASGSSSVLGRRRKSVRPSFHHVKRHPSVQKRYLEFVPMAADSGGISKGGYQKKEYHEANSDPYGGFTIMGCKWYDFSCLLRYLFTGHILGGVREPAYDANTFPDSVDWRDMGVVTSVHSQGACGACWAITAVETIESANAIRTGSLIDLSESEVIMCDDSCQMCDGGWPQNAFEYTMKHKGLPAESEWSYDGDFLLALTYALSGEGADMDQGELYSYLYSQCPDYGQSGSGKSGSGDEAAYYSAGDAISYTRYASWIGGYGYSTDKCSCYTDGTGCECDEQNEGLAIRNVASYGPAVVCLDASTWQYYEGGILTAESGCQSGFMDMNHCVQAVGYAFVDDNAAEAEGGGDQHSGSGSRDDSQRTGYWIVRNQWGSSWGMNGYIYVAMGDNTCGILNDMTQVY